MRILRYILDESIELTQYGGAVQTKIIGYLAFHERGMVTEASDMNDLIKSLHNPQMLDQINKNHKLKAEIDKVKRLMPKLAYRQIIGTTIIFANNV